LQSVAQRRWLSRGCRTRTAMVRVLTPRLLLRTRRFLRTFALIRHRSRVRAARALRREHRVGHGCRTRAQRTRARAPRPSVLIRVAPRGLVPRLRRLAHLSVPRAARRHGRVRRFRAALPSSAAPGPNASAAGRSGASARVGRRASGSRLTPGRRCRVLLSCGAPTSSSARAASGTRVDELRLSGTRDLLRVQAPLLHLASGDVRRSLPAPLRARVSHARGDQRSTGPAVAMRLDLVAPNSRTRAAVVASARLSRRPRRGVAS